MSGSDGAPDADPAPGEVTRILRGFRGGSEPSREDAERLAALVQEELRALAGRLLARERRDHTLQPTALVNEAWLRLADQRGVEWTGRAHFLSIAAQAMRRILIDHARGTLASKRGGGRARAGADALDLEAEPAAIPALELLALDEALTRLRGLHAPRARLVELRFFGGLGMEETAAILGLPLRTAEREWRLARAWLGHELSK